MKKRILAILLICLLMVSAFAGCAKTPDDGGSATSGTTGTGSVAEPAAEPAPATVYLTLATTPASSAMYPYCVGVAKAITSVYPELQITTTEGTGALANTKLIRNGTVNIGTCVSNTDYENFNGTGSFEGDPYKDVRLLWYFDYTPLQLVVAKDSGIQSLQDLTGKRFNAGGVGTSAEILCMGAMDVLGIKPEYFPAGQSDAGEAYTGRQIDGVTKTGPAGDSYIMQLAAARDITLLGFTEEEFEKVHAAFPYVSKYTVPANSYVGVDYSVDTLMTFTGLQATSALPQEVVYKMAKAVMEDGKPVWTSSYPKGADVDILGILTESAVIPIHAGVVQYLEEKGYTVPAELIPPEYKKA